MVRASAWMLGHRAISAIAALVIVLGLGGFSANVVVRNDLAVWFVDGDPALQAYRAFLEEFGSDEVVVLAAPLEEGAASAAGLAKLAKWEAALRAVEGVERTLSLSSLPAPATDGQVARVGTDPARAAATLKAARHPARLVGEDGKTAAVYLWVAQVPDIDQRRAGIYAALDEATTKALGEEQRVLKAGGGVVYEAINQLTITEGAAFIGLAYLVVIIALLVVTRRILWTVVACGVVTLVDIGLFGAMGLLGVPVNAVTAALPTLCMILGVANVVHLSLAVERAGDDEDLAEAIGRVALPCAFNALTTAGALLSLLSASMRVTRELGLFAAVGVVLAFGISFVAVTSLAAGSRKRAKGHVHQRRGALVGRLAATAAARPWVTAAAFALFSLGFVGLAADVEVDTLTIDFLDEAHEARRDHRAVEAGLGPYIPLELRVDSGGEWARVELLRDVEALTRSLEADPAFASATSVVDLLTSVNASFTGAAKLPETDAAVAQIAGLIELEDASALRAVVSKDGGLRVTVAIPMASAKEMVAAGGRAQEIAQELGLKTVSTGYLPLYGAMVSNLVRDQVVSFGLALVVVFGLMAIVVRSWRLWLLALPVNLFPVLAVGGAMGLLGLRLDAATVSIAAIILGVVVDDSVHLLVRLRHDRDHPPLERVVRAAERSGLAIVSTSCIFIAGFAVLSGAGLKTIAWMGLLSAIGVAAALIGDLLLLPALGRVLLKRGDA
jgi:predicted RND superfamily exporter protein